MTEQTIAVTIKRQWPVESFAELLNPLIESRRDTHEDQPVETHFLRRKKYLEKVKASNTERMSLGPKDNRRITILGDDTDVWRILARKVILEPFQVMLANEPVRMTLVWRIDYYSGINIYNDSCYSAEFAYERKHRNKNKNNLGYICQMDNSIRTVEVETVCTPSWADKMRASDDILDDDADSLFPEPKGTFVEGYIHNCSIPNFVKFEDPSPPEWVDALEGYHDIGDLYLDDDSKISKISEPVRYAQGPYWDSDEKKRSHEFVFQQYKERANTALTNIPQYVNVSTILLYSEKLALLLSALTAQTTYRGFITTIVYALKDFGVISTKKSLLFAVIELCKEYLDSDVNDQFQDFSLTTEEEYGCVRGDDGFECQSAERVKIALDAMVDCLRNPMRIAKNPIVKGCVRFLRAITALGMMTYCQGDYSISGIKMFAIEPIQGGAFEVFAVLADSLQNFLDYGYAMVMEKTLFPIGYSFDKLHDLELRVAEMEAWMPFFENGRLQERGMQRSDYLIKLKTIKEHILQVRRSAPDKFAEKTLSVLYAKMEKLSTRATMVTLASGLKYCPFGYSIAGPAGIGKSSVNDHFINKFFKWKKTEQDWKPEGKDEEYRVTVNMSDKFQSEVFSHHIVAVLDDFMNKRAEKVAPGETPHDLLIKIINNVPCTALKPDVESKGAVPMNFELVGLTTNVAHLHATLFVNDEYSILRRVAFTVFPFVKEQFRKEQQECLDPNKAMGNTELWEFDVMKPIAVKEGNKMVIKWAYYDLPPSIINDSKQTSSKISLFQLLILFEHELNRHHEAQIRILEQAKCQDKTCKHGFPHDICGICVAESQEYEPPEKFDEGEIEPFVEEKNEYRNYTVNSEPLLTSQQMLKKLNRGNAQPRALKRRRMPENAVIFSEPTTGICHPMEVIHEEVLLPDKVEVQCPQPEMINQNWAMSAYAMKFIEDTAEKICPWRLEDNPIRVTYPWLIDFVPRVILNAYPDILEVSHLTKTTIRNRRIIAMSLVGMFGINILHMMCRVVMGRHVICNFIMFIALTASLIHMHNQHAALVSHYYVSRNLRWSNLLALQWMPPLMRRRLSVLWTLVFVAGALTLVRNIIAKLVAPIHKRENEPAITRDRVVEGDCQGGIISIPNARPVWGGVQCVPLTKSEDHNMTFSQIFGVVKKSMASIEYITADDRICQCTCLILKSGLVLVPTHFIPKTLTNVTIYVGSREHSGGIIKCILCRADGFPLKDRDLTIYHVPNLGDRKNLVPLLSKDMSTDTVICKSLYKDKVGDLKINDFFIKAEYREGLRASYTDKSEFFESNGFCYELRENTFIGLCGMILICNAKVPYIHSYHTSGRDKFGVSHAITARDVEQAEKFLYSEQCARMRPTDAGEFNIQRVKNFTMQSQPTAKSPLMFLDKDTSFEYYGTINTPVVKFKHSVHKTLIHDTINEVFNVEPKVGPPPNVPTWQHHHACIMNTTAANVGFPQALMERAAKDYLDGTLETMRARVDLKKLSLDQILNGEDGVRGLEPMNKKTSAGFPYFQSKSKLFGATEGEPLVITPELLTDYNVSERAWAENKRSYEIFHQSLKDEPVKKTKTVTRTFQCSNLNLTIALRKYFLPIVTELITKPDVYELAVGCNAEGPEWHALMLIISKYGEDRIVAGDYKNYDQRMSSQVICAAFSILIEFAAAIGYSNDDLSMMRAIATEVVYPVIHMNGDIFKLFSSVTSGNSLTTIINCICNSLLHRMCYYGLAQRLGLVAPPFKSVCSLLTYGDDCADSVRPGFDWFGHTNRQIFFGDFNIIYTMAEKDQVSRPFITLQELSFLKRRPQYNSDTDLMMAPLDESSIFKSLQFLTRSILTPEESVGVNADNALAAWFQHGRTIYEARSHLLRQVLIKHDLYHFSKWADRTYDDFLREWKSKYQAGMPAICLEHPGRKTQECDDGIDYDVLLAAKLGNMLGAYRCEAVSPVETPLFRGGEADHNTSSIFQAGTCLGSCECKNLYPKQHKDKHRMMSPVPQMDGKERAQLVGDVNLKTSRPKMVKQASQKSLFKPLTTEDIDMILLDDVEQCGPDFSEITVPQEIRKPTLDEINAMYAQWVRDNHNATPVRTNTTEILDRSAYYEPPQFAKDVRSGDYVFQAGTNTTSPSTQGRTAAGTVVFSDTDANIINTVAGEMDSTRYLAANAADSMAAFLSRPLLVQTITVAVGANTFVEFNPWKRFFDNKRIINRVTNYNNIRGRMHVKFLINGNGFYYGKIIASYLPLKAGDNLEHDHTTPSPANICLATQRPHIFLDPCMSTGGQLDLPFFFWKDAMNIPAQDWTQMGQIFVESINPLRNANGSTADLTITVFAWMSEVTLDSPTLTAPTNLIAQAGEYEEKDIISRPASIVSNAATTIAPFLGSLAPYAMAVSQSAGMVASAAKAFGYSRPTTVQQPMKMMPRHIANLANYDVVDNGTKLSLDVKNEVTVDTRVMGLAGEEETSFTYLASISNYLRSTQWNATQLTGTKLTSIRAWPLHRIPHGTLVASAYPSYALPTFDFAYWTGTFVLKIEVVCSSFHKGRLQIVYDPNNVDAAPETNIQHTYIMDISDTKELVIDIPWSQSRTFLNSPPLWPNQALTDIGLDNTGTSPYANGQIGIYVLNELTVPSASTLPIEINVYGSFKDDYKVMCPERTYPDAIFRTLTTQSGEMDCAEDCQMPDDTAVEYSAGGDSRNEKQLAVYAGESITSFRALWKRPHLLYIFPKNTVQNTGTTYVFPLRAKPRGTIPTFTNYNLAANSGLTMASYAYAAWRGSVRYKCVTQGPRSQISFFSNLFPGSGFGSVSRVISYTFGTTTTVNDLARSMNALLAPIRNNKGQEVQNSQHQPMTEAEYPYYSLNRFFPQRNLGFELQTGERIVNLDTMHYELSATGQHEIYMSTGEDFQVGFFTGLPLLATFSNPAPPVAA
nr:MAG: hypothetical protein [Marnaviridae sp.]